MSTPPRRRRARCSSSRGWHARDGCSKSMPWRCCRRNDRGLRGLVVFQVGGRRVNKFLAGLFLAAGAWTVSAMAPEAADLKIALIYSKTGPLEAYAKQTETGLNLGFEYLTGGTMTLDGRKIVIIAKDDQGKPDVAKSLLEQAYADDNVDIAIGTTSSGATLAMLPVAEDAKKILLVEPAVADSITGDSGTATFSAAAAIPRRTRLPRPSLSARTMSRSAC